MIDATDIYFDKSAEHNFRLTSSLAWTSHDLETSFSIEVPNIIIINPDAAASPNTYNVTSPTIMKVRGFRKYLDGWNGPDSIGPSDKAREEAEQFANSLDLDAIHPPEIGLADDGEINFFWDVNNLYLDLGFFGNGTYSFYAKLPNGEEIIEDSALITQPLPENISYHLKIVD